MLTRLNLLSRVFRQGFQMLNFSLDGHDSCSEIYSLYLSSKLLTSLVLH